MGNSDYVKELEGMRHGTAELARYTPLINLLNEVGGELKPYEEREYTAGELRVRGRPDGRELTAGA